MDTTLLPEQCTLCPRACNAPRMEDNGYGFCQMPRTPLLARAALHHWEEPPLSGTMGAGAVFFSGCSLGCLYCQNYGISHEHYGKAVSLPRLREIFEELIDQGAHTIDLVNPTHFAHAIVAALKTPLSVPVVWNSSGYESISTLKALEGHVQIYLPDFKYPDPEGAAIFSNAPDYPQGAKAAIAEMVRQTGPYRLDQAGLLKQGVMIRHLILPGRLREAKEVMDWVAASFPPKTVLFSLMSQYLPLGSAHLQPSINRRLRPSEIKAAISYMSALGLEGYVQDQDSAEKAFVPTFDLTGL